MCLLQMSICAVQSVDLHKEALDNLHLTVDTNVKVGPPQSGGASFPFQSLPPSLPPLPPSRQTTYTFLAKLEELHNSLGPLTHISAQVYPTLCCGPHVLEGRGGGGLCTSLLHVVLHKVPRCLPSCWLLLDPLTYCSQEISESLKVLERAFNKKQP